MNLFQFLLFSRHIKIFAWIFFSFTYIAEEEYWLQFNTTHVCFIQTEIRNSRWKTSTKKMVNFIAKNVLHGVIEMYAFVYACICWTRVSNFQRFLSHCWFSQVNFNKIVCIYCLRRSICCFHLLLSSIQNFKPMFLNVHFLAISLFSTFVTAWPSLLWNFICNSIQIWCHIHENKHNYLSTTYFRKWI